MTTTDTEIQVVALSEPQAKPVNRGHFQPGYDPRRPTDPSKAARGFKMNTSRRSLAAALRERIPAEQIAEWLYKAAFEGIDPRTQYGPDGLPIVVYPKLTFDQILKVMAIIVERCEGLPTQRAVLEEEARRALADLEARPDYSALTNEELESIRAAQRKAVEAGRARHRALTAAMPLHDAAPVPVLGSGEEQKP